MKDGGTNMGGIPVASRKGEDGSDASARNGGSSNIKWHVFDFLKSLSKAYGSSLNYSICTMPANGLIM